MERPTTEIDEMTKYWNFDSSAHALYFINIRKYITALEAELQRYKQAPGIPHIKGGTCNTTHSACDCVIANTARLEAELKAAQDHAVTMEAKLKNSVPFEVFGNLCTADNCPLTKG